MSFSGSTSSRLQRLHFRARRGACRRPYVCAPKSEWRNPDHRMRQRLPPMLRFHACPRPGPRKPPSTSWTQCPTSCSAPPDSRTARHGARSCFDPSTVSHPRSTESCRPPSKSTSSMPSTQRGKLPWTSCRAGHRANMTTAASSQATCSRPSTDFGTSSATSGPCMTQLRPYGTSDQTGRFITSGGLRGGSRAIPSK